jgi:hypothetical protein
MSNTIINSGEFVKFVETLSISDNETMCSFDILIINLFTNISVELTLEIIYM